jgi:hypothetical protein
VSSAQPLYRYPLCRSFACATFLSLWIAPHAARAQTDAPRDCPGGAISFVYIDNQAMFNAEDPELDGRVRFAYRLANALHFRTRESVIRRELLFDPGDCYDPFRLSESERLLRAWDIFANVDVFGVLQPDSTWHVIVSTRDEWSTRVDVRVRVDNGIELQGVRVFETNLLGRAHALGAFYYQREVRRDYGMSYYTPQLVNTRWDFGAAVGRTRAGTFFSEAIGYPFLGEIGHWGGRQAFSRNDQYFEYIARDATELDSPHLLLQMREKFFDMSALRRIGDRGHMTLLGAGVTAEQLTYPGRVESAPAGDFGRRTLADSAAAAAVLEKARSLEAVRASVLVGRRDVSWLTRRGLDSMRGEQDVRLGTEIGLVAGRSIPAFARDDDWRFTLSTYAGFEHFGAFVVARARGDARYEMDDASDAGWQDVLADAELLAYWRRARLPRHTLVLRAAAAGAWHTRTPFQLTLGGERAVRGYDFERYPGGRRLVLNMEDRIYLGWPFRDLFDAGLTVFGDVGRIWPGDVPFGGDSGWRAAAGLGLRTSFPAGGRTAYRFDFAWPVEKGVRLSDVRFRFSLGEIIGLVPREADFQILRSRPEGAAGNLFDFRNR